MDQEIAQPPITSLIPFKEQGYAIIELQTPEMATACLAMDGLPYEYGCAGLDESIMFLEEAALALFALPTSTPRKFPTPKVVPHVCRWRR